MIRRTAALALLVSTAALPARADALKEATAKDLPYVVALYQQLHAYPELSFQEVQSAKRMAVELKKAGFAVTQHVGKHGVVAVMKNGAGPTVLVRADMDALPVTEETGLPYASKVMATLPNGQKTGVMHACAHDIHMANLIGTARRLSAMKDQWRGTLILIGQPAEELGNGAEAMLKDGLYARFGTPDYILGLHGLPALAAGTIGMTNGYMLANVDSVDVTIRGVGGHGSLPHWTRDPVVIAARTIMGWQTLISREKDPMEPAVLTVGAIHGGTKHNIIPNDVKMQITVRSYAEETRKAILDGIARIAKGEAISAGVPEDLMPIIDFSEGGTPALFNTDKISRQMQDVFTARFGAQNVVHTKPVMGGEDFSEFYRANKKAESLFFWLGTSDPAFYASVNGDPNKIPGNHTSKNAPKADLTLQTGIEAMTTAVLTLMKP